MFAAYSQIGLTSKRFIFKTVILAVCVCMWALPAIAGESPQTVVQTGMDQIFEILKQYPQDTPARREMILAVVDRYFDFEAIARLAIGPQWGSVPPEKRKEFTQGFSRLLFDTYIGDIEKYAGQKIAYNTKSVAQGYTVVEALVKEQGGPVSLDYSLHLRDGNWKVYDVSVQGMSLAVNYRSQFDSILANGSFDDLLRTLKEKIAQVCASNRC